jgi:hypothetical protein
MKTTQTGIAALLVTTFAVAGSVDAAQIAIISNTRFAGTVNGTGGPIWTQISANPSYSSPTEPQLQSAARANGASDWDLNTPNTLLKKWNVSDISQVDPLVNAALNGSWQLDYGAGPRALDTTSGYRSISTAAVVGLSAQGVADMLAINSSGVAGTYSLALDQSVQSYLAQGWTMSYQYMDFNGMHFGSTTGSSISLDLTEGFGKVFNMVMIATRVTYSTTSPDGIFFAVNQTASIEYNFNSIPAPGAIALLGLAGLTGRRRR